MLLRAGGESSVLRTALGSDVKGKISPLLYCLGIGLSFADRWIALAVYVGVALMWLVPDRRVDAGLSGLAGSRGRAARPRHRPAGSPGPRIERLLEPALGASLVVERRDLTGPSLFGQGAEMRVRKLEVRRSAAGSADAAADSS
jgi:hypothetical protein